VYFYNNINSGAFYENEKQHFLSKTKRFYTTKMVFFYGLTYLVPELNTPKPVPLQNVNVEANGNYKRVKVIKKRTILPFNGFPA